MAIDFSEFGFEAEEPLVATTLTRDDENEGSLRESNWQKALSQ